MATHVLAVELPDEVIALLGPPETAAAAARETLVLALLGEGRIGQSLAAQLLGLSRGQLLELMAQRRIPSGPETAEETQRELTDVRGLMREQSARGGHQ